MTAASSSIAQASNPYPRLLAAAAVALGHDGGNTVESMRPFAVELTDKIRVGYSTTLGRLLIGVYVTAWAAGEAAARHALVELTKADDVEAIITDALALLDVTVDWTDWTPGDLQAAGIVYGDGLAELLTFAVGQPGNDGWASRAAARGNILASIADSRLDKAANVIAQSLAEGWTADTLEAELHGLLDDPTWADRVAVTETARGMTAATLATYADHAVPGKEFLTAPDQRVCVLCEENAEMGPVPLTDRFVNGDPPVHPSCRCALLPVFTTATPDEDPEGETSD